MHKNKIFLIALFLTATTFYFIAEQLNLFPKKFKYDPDWNQISDLKEYSKKKNYGTPLNCKRSDFVKNILDEGSTWLLTRNWSKKTYDNWFYDFIPPLYLNYGADTPVCQSFANNFDFFAKKENTRIFHNIFKPIKKINWDNDIAQLELNTLENSKMIEIDFDNDGKKELIYTTGSYYLKSHINNKYNYDTYNGYAAEFSNNFDEIKSYLSQPNLILKNKNDFDEIVKKFNGKEIKFNYLPDFDEETNSWSLPLLDLKFFEFDNKIYMLSNNEIVSLVEKNKPKYLCGFNLKEFKLNNGYDCMACHVIANNYGKLVGEENVKKYSYDINNAETQNYIASTYCNSKNQLRIVYDFTEKPKTEIINNDPPVLSTKSKKSYRTLPDEFNIKNILKYDDLTGYDWDINIAQMQANRLESSPDKIVQVDFNNDGKDELIHITGEYYLTDDITTREAAVYYDNLDEVKTYLKAPDLIIKNRKDFSKIIKKFNGKEIIFSGEPRFNKKKNRWSLPLENPSFFKFKNKNYLFERTPKSSHIYIIEQNTFNEKCFLENSFSFCGDDPEVLFCEKAAIYNKIYVDDEIENAFEDYIDKNFSIKPYEWEILPSKILIDKTDTSKIIEVDFNNDGKLELIYTTGIYSLDGINNNVDTALFYRNIKEVKKYLNQPDLILKNYDDFVKIAKKFESDLFIHERYPIEDKKASNHFNGEIGYDVYLDNIILANNFLNNPDELTIDKDIFIRFVKHFNPEPLITKELWEFNKYFDLNQNFKFNNFTFFKYNNVNYVFDGYNNVVYLINSNKNELICTFENIRLYREENIPTDIIKIIAAQNIPKYHINEDVPLYDKSFIDEINLRLGKEFYLFNDTEIAVKQYLFDKVKELCGADLNAIENAEKTE